jgi:hypothetical protein
MADEISPNTGEPISGETAKRWIDKYKEKHPAPDEVIATFYGSEIINQILSQSDCIGIRFYHAYDDTNIRHLILVGVDSGGNNLWDLNASQPSDGGLVAQYGMNCPPWCPPSK